MENLDLENIEAMLLVLYKKIDKMERDAKGGYRSAPDSTYMQEFKAEAAKIKESLKKETPSN